MIIEMQKRLLDIKKDELSEREFFHAVLTVIKDMGDTNLIYMEEEDFGILKPTLKRIGCVDYKTWIEQKSREGEKIDDTEDIRSGTKDARINTAAYFVAQFLGTRSEASYAFGKMIEGGFVEGWLENSEKILEREKLEREIIKDADTKRKLEDELADIEKEIKDSKDVVPEER